MKSILFTIIFPSLLIVMCLEAGSMEVNTVVDHHICAKVVSYDEEILIPKTKWEKYEIKHWCLKIPPVCTKHKYKLVTVNETITLTKTKLAYGCCRGFQNESNTCVPVCTLGCHNGECVEPEICVCNEGWRGHNCSEECKNTTYGLDCLDDCTCENRGWCDYRGLTAFKKYRVCICPPGFTGDHCELECPEGWYGMNCKYTCQCQNNAHCMIENGYCECQPGYEGDYCEHKCEPGFHGMFCETDCACEKDTTEICHHEDGRCICKPGYTGKYCQNLCPYMTYGVGCVEHCKCENAIFCEPTNGTCICEIGWIGETCSEKCPEGYFGEGCKDKCLKCNSDKAVCNHVTGVCECYPGYYGSSCEITCPEKFWGSSCCNFCNCSENETCDPKTGECNCKAGWTGENCSTPCPPNYWGPNCTNECECSVHGTCGADNGKCICNDGWIDPACTTGWKPLHFLLPLFPIVMVVGAILYVNFLHPIISERFHSCKRSSSNQELQTSEENFGVHFRNPLYNVEYSKELTSDTADTHPAGRSVSFVDIMSSIRASMQEKASSCEFGIDSGLEAISKRASKVSNLSASNALSNVGEESVKPFSISDELDKDFVPETLNDFNTSENITLTLDAEQGVDSAKNK